MQSAALTVSDYLDEVPAERRETLNRLRETCRAWLTGFEEKMEYGMPVYLRNGTAEVGFASQKHFIALYILRTDVMNTHRDRLTARGISLGKGCIRYSKPACIDFEVVESLLRATVESTGAVC